MICGVSDSLFSLCLCRSLFSSGLPCVGRAPLWLLWLQRWSSRETIANKQFFLAFSQYKRHLQCFFTFKWNYRRNMYRGSYMVSFIFSAGLVFFTEALSSALNICYNQIQYEYLTFSTISSTLIATALQTNWFVTLYINFEYRDHKWSLIKKKKHLFSAHSVINKQKMFFRWYRTIGVVFFLSDALNRWFPGFIGKSVLNYLLLSFS